MGRLGWLAAGGAAVVLAGCSPAGARLEAGGATSLDPLVQGWAAEYRRTAGVEVDYSKKGSGYGVAQVAAGTLDFGLTDDPPTPAELHRAAAAARTLVLVPVAVGAVAVVYHLPGLDRPLVLSGPVLAAVFGRRVTRWDDPAVAALNPGVDLPPAAIVPVVRAEASGTTATLTGYLSRADGRFAAAVGASRKPRWPAGVVGQEGSDGVTGFVERTPGSVGYVEGRYARRAGLPRAAVVNRRGRAVLPDPAGALAAAEAADADAAYPLAGLGYAVLTDRPPAGVVRFLRWAVTDGQRLAGPLDYAPLPPRLAGRAADQLRELGD